MLLHPHQKPIASSKACALCTNKLDWRNKSGMCKDCYPKHRVKMSKEERLRYLYSWRKKNPDKVRATTRRNYVKNRESLLKRARKSQLKRKYGLSVAEYESLLLEQEYRCAICLKHKADNTNGYTLAVDHNHATGKVRGLLCASCNLSLGGFQDSEDLLLKAILYLKKYATTR